MKDADDEAGVDRWRTLVEQLVQRVGGLAAVQVLMSTLAVYDGAGGGLVAGGLAYASLIALLPGLLLVLSIVGGLLGDPAAREQVVAAIAAAFPPLESLARMALDQVAAGAVPTGIVAVIGLLWGASRFYAALDYALSKVFHNAPRRNEIQRTIRGLLVTGIFVVLPVAIIVASSMADWLRDRTAGGLEIAGDAGATWRLASLVGSIALFVGGTAAVYRWVPAMRVPYRALLPPAGLAGLILAGFTQLFTLIAPLLGGVAALYGAIGGVFLLLAWLSIGFNLLLLGASWTRVRQLALAGPGSGPADGDPRASPSHSLEGDRSARQD